MAFRSPKEFVLAQPLSVFALLFIAGSIALKDVSVYVPLAVPVMDTVTLQCRYNLQDEPLYTVKWYKDLDEFYRYIPKELPSTQVFPLSGINVDLSKSSPNQVVLQNVQPEVTGHYKCEVSSDAPNFYKFIDSGEMFVIDVPRDPPVMNFEKDPLEMGYKVKGNCTAPPSFPPVNITWYLNGRQINGSHEHLIPDSNSIPAESWRQPHMTQSVLDLEMDANTFEGGMARLKCVGKIFNLYQKDAELVLEEDKPRLRPPSELRTKDATDSGMVMQASSTALLTIAGFWLVLR